MSDKDLGIGEPPDHRLRRLKPLRLSGITNPGLLQLASDLSFAAKMQAERKGSKDKKSMSRRKIRDREEVGASALGWLASPVYEYLQLCRATYTAVPGARAGGPDRG